MRAAFITALVLGSNAVQAHTGQAASGLYEGLIHPFGLDHLLAMVAVGVWSVSVLSARKAWLGPVTFMAALVIGATVAAAGFTVPYLESLISLSVVLFGAMLVVSRTQTPVNVGFALIAIGASLHGLAHGAEPPETDFAAYAASFLLTTAVLHLGGVVTGLTIRRYFSNQAPWAIRILGVGCGGAGLYLLSQL